MLRPDVGTSQKEDPGGGNEGVDKVIRTEGASHQHECLHLKGAVNHRNLNTFSAKFIHVFNTYTVLVLEALKQSSEEQPTGK